MATNILNTKLATILFGLLALMIITPRHCMADNFLLTPNSLRGSQSLVYGNYEFALQGSACNLALYDNGVAEWLSNVPPPDAASLGCYATMQEDGNFVLYTSSGQTIWSSGSSQGSTHSYVLILQPDRNVVIYGGTVWASKTNIPPTTSISGENSTATVVTGTATGGGDDAVMVI